MKALLQTNLYALYPYHGNAVADTRAWWWLRKDPAVSCDEP
jgi:hypothetical protein